VNARLIDWIWHVRGSVPLVPEESGDDAFDRLEPLFQKPGTSHERTDSTLAFRKRDAVAQDRMAVFDGGVLTIEPGPAGQVLRYEMRSRALLACFLVPLLFLAFAQIPVALNKYEKPTAAEAAAKKKKEEEAERKKGERQLNPIDKMLGAPEPEKPGKDKKEGDKAKKEEDEGKHSPMTAYISAGLFAVLYIVGRILEDRLVKRLFKTTLQAQRRLSPQGRVVS
jgi:hypothetical protein